MNCKQIEEWLITDYLDGRAEIQTKKEVEKHLAQCESCREFNTTVRRTIQEPFETFSREAVPGEVWGHVKQHILDKAAQEEPRWDLSRMRRWVRDFLFPKPVFAVASLLSVFLLAVFLTRNLLHPMADSSNKSEHQSEMLSYLMEYSQVSSEDENGGYGTDIEEIFFQS